MAKKNDKELAQILYLNGYKQTEIAIKLDVSEVSISKWVRQGKWEIMRKNLLTSKKERLSELYEELEEFNRMIKDKEGYKIANSKEADARRKLIADIKELESKYSIGQTISIARDYVNHVREIADMEFAQRSLTYFDMFINKIVNLQKWQSE